MTDNYTAIVTASEYSGVASGMVSVLLIVFVAMMIFPFLRLFDIGSPTKRETREHTDIADVQDIQEETSETSSEPGQSNEKSPELPESDNKDNDSMFNRI